ncbi:MAG: shikimate dehydrogenase [Clostridiales bacterium]|nr:shikimate dehydrogenase [Clostridiales bacterium]
MKKFALIGEKLSHSFSPLLHRFFGSYSYVLCEVSIEELPSLLKNPDYSGFNVTIPYKQEVMVYCDFLSPEAKAIGSVNTLIKKPEGLWGYNTDVDGFLFLLHSAGFDPAGQKCLILGSGGSSLMVQNVLKTLHAKEIIVVSRKGEHHYANLFLHQDAQLIVNTTPVGMYPHEGVSPIDLQGFPCCKGVVDLIYNPLQTPLVLQALRLGIPAIGGLPMLVAQGRKASELFQGISISEDRMLNALAQMEKRFQPPDE